jgi:pyruvate-formate lyase-activating enzyme
LSVAAIRWDKSIGNTQDGVMKDLSAHGNEGKFRDPYVTANGDRRASVALTDPATLWFNTGTLCNIECVNCYIESSPSNDRLVYITPADVIPYLDQLEARKWPVTEIGFTGGEPFMNPDMIDIARVSLERGYAVLILTNAMRPMMRKKMQAGLVSLNADFPEKLTLRISVDHYGADLHDKERGRGSFAKTLTGMEWLRDTGITMTVAGRTVWGESDAESRAGYAAFYRDNGFNIDAYHPAMTVLFPEMDEQVPVPEITTECWDILGKSPTDLMCASSRMVVKRKGDASPTVLACTLLPYAPEFELGTTLQEAERAVHLNHPHCAKFCVLGGASCSAKG